MKNEWLILFLGFCVLGTAISVVYTKHETRKLFVELNGLYKERDEMNVQWGQLQLEQSTLATHGRIESNARDKLKMINPEYENIFIVNPK